MTCRKLVKISRKNYTKLKTLTCIRGILNLFPSLYIYTKTLDTKQRHDISKSVVANNSTDYPSHGSGCITFMLF